MCGTASGWAKMAFVCLLIGMCLHVAGWATNYWMVYETSGAVLSTNVGLWRSQTCNSGTCTEQATEAQYETSDFNGVRALETIVFCLVVFGTVLLAVYIFAEAARRQSVAVVLMVLCFLAGTLSLIGMIVWLVSIPAPFIVSWSLGLTVIAFILVFIAGTLLIPDVFEPYDPYQRSDLVTPYTPPGNRNRRMTPISYGDDRYPAVDYGGRGGGYGGGRGDYGGRQW